MSSPEERERHRKWRKANYARTGEKERARVKAFQLRYPYKHRAHNLVKLAIETGRLVKQPCNNCDNVQSNAHHDYYGKPMPCSPT